MRHFVSVRSAGISRNSQRFFNPFCSLPSNQRVNFRQTYEWPADGDYRLLATQFPPPAIGFILGEVR